MDDARSCSNPPWLREYAATLTPERAALLSQFTLQDEAFKVVGVGSVGTRCLVMLMTVDHGKPLILHLKETSTSVVARFLNVAKTNGAMRPPPEITHNGHRVVHGQRLMQAATDPFLGWATGRSVARSTFANCAT